MQEHAYLTRAKFTDKLWVILKSAGIDDSKYASHSFWSGATTSEAYQVYVKSAPEKLAKSSKQLATAVQKTQQWL